MKMTLALNSLEFETTTEQTQIIPSFTAAPKEQAIFQNLFVCKIPEPSVPALFINVLGLVSEPITDTGAYETISITPVNKLEAPILGFSDTDFDGDQTFN